MATTSSQLLHIEYEYPLTVRVQPRDASWLSQAMAHVLASEPRVRIMQACAHESSWFDPTSASLQQCPRA